MRFSRTIACPTIALLFVTVGFVGTYAQKADQPATGAGQGAKQSSPPNRELRKSGMTKAARPQRDSNAAQWQPPPVPATISTSVAGVARDEAGKAIGGATITLYTMTDKGSKPAGTATTDTVGRYLIRDATLPVLTSFGGHPFRKEITPYAGFILSGLAPGLGIAWSPQRSMYAFKEPYPNDIQGRLPLNSLVTIDLLFPRAAVLKGKVVDENSRPVEGAKLQVADCDLLDDAGRETNNRQGYDWKALPSGVGRAITTRDGGFRIEGLADRACYWVMVNRPETDNAVSAFYAATIDGPDTVHEQLPPSSFNGRGRHEVKTNPITVVFPKIRPIAVAVIGDDTGTPIAGAHVSALGDSLATGIGSYGTTDGAGKVILGLPPGRYRAMVSDPSIETRYIRTYQRPLIVERGEGPQPYVLRQKAGVELIFQAVGTGAGKPIAGAFFWKAPEDKPEETQHIETSTFQGGEPWTDAKGEMRAVLPPRSRQTLPVPVRGDPRAQHARRNQPGDGEQARL